MYGGMFMYGCVCVSLGDGGNVGSQGRTEEAAMALGRSRWSSVPVPLWR